MVDPGATDMARVWAQPSESMGLLGKRGERNGGIEKGLAQEEKGGRQRVERRALLLSLAGSL